MHGYHANGGCGLPGDEQGPGEKCETTAERIARKGTLSEGAHLELRVKRCSPTKFKDQYVN